MWIDQRGSEVLPRGESLRLLAAAAKEGAVGRLAVSTPGAPVLHPVNFAFEEGVVVVRIGVGSMARHVPGNLVAFEVDGIESEPGRAGGVAWSVLVRGLATSLDTVGAATSKLASSPLPMVPEPGEHVVAIRPDVVTGRRFAVGTSVLTGDRGE